MTQLLPFFIVMAAGLVFSTIFNRLHLPWVVALILGGIFIGPHTLGVFTPDATIDFLAEIGLIFLMFMAGLEMRLSQVAKLKKGVFSIAFMNGAIPGVIGVAVGLLLGYSIQAAFVLGIIFVSSSIAVILPSLQSSGISRLTLGKVIIGATMIEDIVSLLLLSVLLQITNPVTTIPLPIFYLMIFLLFGMLRFILPKVRWLFFPQDQSDKDAFERELRLVFVLLIGAVVFFEIIGLHGIIAGFLTGLLVSDFMQSDIMKGKLHALSYGLFIPIFFIVVGARTDIGVLMQSGAALWATGIIIAATVSSKFITGYISGRINRFTARESALVGVATIPQLSNSLAVAFVGLEFGFIDQEFVASILMLSIATTLAGPTLMAVVSTYVHKEKVKNTTQLKLNDYV